MEQDMTDRSTLSQSDHDITARNWAHKASVVAHIFLDVTGIPTHSHAPQCSHASHSLQREYTITNGIRNHLRANTHDLSGHIGSHSTGTLYHKPTC